MSQRLLKNDLQRVHKRAHKLKIMKGHNFAKRSDGIDSSFIRDILSLAQNENVISFAGGLPNARLFPYKQIRKAANKILSSAKSAQLALQYGSSSGYQPLKEIIAKTYKEKDGLNIDPDLMLITNGSQQAIDLIGKIFINKGESVLLEEASYLASMQAFAFYEPKFKSVPLVKNGPDVDKLKKLENIKLFYFVPNFQNPTGVTWSSSTRKEVAKWARENNSLLFEDDPYGEIRFEGRREKPLAFYNKSQTILSGSFSKILSPGIRTAWIIAPNKSVFEKLIVAKQASDLQSSQFSQIIISEFYKNFDAQAHIEELSRTYKKQRDCLAEELSKHLADFEFQIPEGGMFLWGQFASNIDTVDFLRYAVKHGVAFVPGGPFFVEAKKKNFARFSFSNSSCAQIKEGVRRLKLAYQKYLASIQKS